MVITTAAVVADRVLCAHACMPNPTHVATTARYNSARHAAPVVGTAACRATDGPGKLGKPELGDDPRFRSNGDRLTNRDALRAELAALLADVDGNELTDRLLAATFAAAIFFATGRNLFYGVFSGSAALLAITFLDIDHWWVPDIITFPCMVWALAAAFLPNGLSPAGAAAGVIPAVGLWLVTRHDDVKRVTTEPETFTAATDPSRVMANLSVIRGRPVLR